MKMLYAAKTSLEANELKLVLDNAGLQAIVRGESGAALFGLGAGEYPEVWISDDTNFERARMLVEEFLGKTRKDAAPAATWTCPQCGQQLEAQFQECWKCADTETSGEKKPASPPMPRMQVILFVIAVLIAIIMLAALLKPEMHPINQLAPPISPRPNPLGQ